MSIQTSAKQQTKTTGSLNGWQNMWNNLFGGSASPPPQPTQSTQPIEPDKRSHMEKLREGVMSHDEDYKNWGERVLGSFVQLIGYVGPFLLMAFVGNDLGQFFMATMGPFSAYGLSFTMEGVIAACTVAMGRAFEEMASGKGSGPKTAAVVLIWLILNASSAFGLYLVITNYNQIVQGGIVQWSMIIRVLAIALCDLGCSAVLLYKGRSLQNHINAIRKQATAIGELADAERSMQEADKNAKLREQQMQATLKIQEDLSAKIGDAVSMVMTNILERMEKALKDDGKNDRGYGRY